jgi:hypothetical protein
LPPLLAHAFANVMRNQISAVLIQNVSHDRHDRVTQ